MLDQAFDALKTFDYGTDPKALRPIDEAVVKCHGDDAARAKLEAQLAAVLATKTPHAATDYVCRKLMLIGSAACVPALAELLPHKDLSHLAQYALERIPGSEASAALRKALGAVKTPLDIGMISSLSARGDAESVSKLGELVGSSDAAVSKAAACAARHHRQRRRGGGVGQGRCERRRSQDCRDRRHARVRRESGRGGKEGRGPEALQVAFRRRPAKTCGIGREARRAGLLGVEGGVRLRDLVAEVARLP